MLDRNLKYILIQHHSMSSEYEIEFGVEVGTKGTGPERKVRYNDGGKRLTSIQQSLQQSVAVLPTKRM
jgi:hypothetical protein